MFACWLACCWLFGVSGDSGWLLFSSTLIWLLFSSTAVGSWVLHHQGWDFFHLPNLLHFFSMWHTLLHPSSEQANLLFWVTLPLHLSHFNTVEHGPGLSSMSPAKISRSLRSTGVPKKTHHLGIGFGLLSDVCWLVGLVVRCLQLSGIEPLKLSSLDWIASSPWNGVLLRPVNGESVRGITDVDLVLYFLG